MDASAADLSPGDPPLPVVLSYCATFLPPEMLHVYRQVCGVTTFRQWVVTRRRANADRFPFPRVVVLRKGPLRGLARAWARARGRRPLLGRGEVRQLLELAQDKDAAVVHVYLGTEAARALPYLRLEARAKVVSFHGADVSAAMSDREIAQVSGAADLVLARTESLVEVLAGRGVPRERLRVHRSGVPVPTAPPHHDLPDGAQPLRLLQACRLIPKKGLDTTLQALARVRSAGLPARLDIAGSGPLEGELRRLCAHLGLESEVRFLGFVDNRRLLEDLAQYHLFLHPSRTTADGDQEGVPNSLLEAMAHGLPVVATNHGGIPEVVRDDRNGLLIPASDPEALARAILRLAGDRGRYRRLSASARATAASDFSVAVSVARLEACYREAMDLARRRQGGAP